MYKISPQMIKHKMVVNWVTFNRIFLFLFNGILLVSCHTTKVVSRNEHEIIKNNCSGFTFNHTNKYEQIPDSVILYGTIKICATGNRVAHSTILIAHDSGEEFKTKADKNGTFKITIKEGFNKIRVDGGAAYIDIPYIYMGIFGGCIEMNLDLMDVVSIVNELNDTSLKKEVEKLRKVR